MEKALCFSRRGTDALRAGPSPHISHSFYVAAQSRLSADFSSVGLLDVVLTMPARPSVGKVTIQAPLGRLATNQCEIYGLAADVPPAPQPWESWVLHGHEERACPFVWNSGDDRRCVWPGEPLLDLDRSGGRFQQTLRVYRDSWVTLPGSAGLWPRKVAAGYRRGESARDLPPDRQPHHAR